MAMFKLILAVNFSLIALCSAFPKVNLLRATNRIVGGFEIDIEEVPWQISLQSYSSHTCGGSIIGDKWILTAAHCVSSSKPEQITLRIGSHYYGSSGSIIKTKNIFAHNEYNSRTIDYDYALVELHDALNFTDQIQPVALPSIDEEIPDGTFCLISGWGNTQNSSESRSKLRGAEVPVVNQDICAQAYKSTNNVTPRMICAGFEQGGKDSCQGDSGGPMTCVSTRDAQRKLYGVVSWGYGCARPSYPGVYSRVQAARQWINEVSGI